MKTDQQRLHEIEESIFWSTGAIQANPNFHFGLTDEEKYLRLVVSSMELHHESIVDFIDRLFEHQVYAERYYRAVLEDTVSYLHKREDSYN